MGKNTLTLKGTAVDRAWKKADWLEKEAGELKESGDVDCLALAEEYEEEAAELRAVFNNDAAK